MKGIEFNKVVKTIDSHVNIYYSRDWQKENWCRSRKTTNKNKGNNGELNRKRKSK